MDGDVTMLGYRTYGPANLLLSFPLGVPPHMRAGIRELSQLSVLEPDRGQGHASKLLDAVCAEADKSRKVLLLMPSAYEAGGLDDLALIAWYRRHGFIVIQRNPILMARQPRGITSLDLRTVHPFNKSASGGGSPSPSSVTASDPAASGAGEQVLI